MKRRYRFPSFTIPELPKKPRGSVFNKAVSGFILINWSQYFGELDLCLACYCSNCRNEYYITSRKSVNGICTNLFSPIKALISKNMDAHVFFVIIDVPPVSEISTAGKSWAGSIYKLRHRWTFNSS